MENLYNAVHERRRQGLPFYKKDKYSLVEKKDIRDLSLIMKMENTSEWILFARKEMIPYLSFDLLRNVQ